MMKKNILQNPAMLIKIYKDKCTTCKINVCNLLFQLPSIINNNTYTDFRLWNQILCLYTTTARMKFIIIY